jgi:hypothetical protein
LRKKIAGAGAGTRSMKRFMTSRIKIGQRAYEKVTECRGAGVEAGNETRAGAGAKNLKNRSIWMMWSRKHTN